MEEIKVIMAVSDLPLQIGARLSHAERHAEKEPWTLDLVHGSRSRVGQVRRGCRCPAGDFLQTDLKF
jgi:hypothetical protein